MIRYGRNLAIVSSLQCTKGIYKKLTEIMEKREETFSLS